MTALRLKGDARHTINASYLAIIGQAVVNNFIPLLLLTFESEFGIDRAKVTVLLGYNFFIQLATDFVAAFVVDKVGYRRAIVFGQVCTFFGMVALAVLPGMMDPFLGLMIAVTVYAIGGGIAEVLVSPIVEHAPTPAEKKASAMTMLHSFYCWGHVFVVIMSSLFFLAFGIKNWRILAVIWSLLPLANGWYFTKVPITQPPHQEGMRGALRLAKSPTFWFLFLMMVCSGASEQSVSQWASAFAESGLKVSKAVGDLAGPTFFAVLMGISRVVHSHQSDKRPLQTSMTLSALLCVGAYLLIIFSPWPWLSLIGVGLTGYAVGLFWPGTLSLAALRLPTGGTAMYALLALGGDVGCSVGPSVVGFVSKAAEGQLLWGFAAAIVFPVALVLMLRQRRKTAAT